MSLRISTGGVIVAILMVLNSGFAAAQDDVDRDDIVGDLRDERRERNAAIERRAELLALQNSEQLVPFSDAALINSLPERATELPDDLKSVLLGVAPHRAFSTPLNENQETYAARIVGQLNEAEIEEQLSRLGVSEETLASLSQLDENKSRWTTREIAIRGTFAHSSNPTKRNNGKSDNFGDVYAEGVIGRPFRNEKGGLTGGEIQLVGYGQYRNFADNVGTDNSNAGATIVSASGSLTSRFSSAPEGSVDSLPRVSFTTGSAAFSTSTSTSSVESGLAIGAMAASFAGLERSASNRASACCRSAREIWCSSGAAVVGCA